MKTILPLLLLALFYVTRAQSVEEAYQKPLKEVLQKVETRFGIKINCSEGLMTGKTVTFADWRFRSDPEATLNLILGPQDMVFTKTGEKQYLVEAFQYHKRPVEEGRIHLRQLSGLYSSLPEWESRKASLQSCMREKLKLPPFPLKNPLNPVYANKRNFDVYMAENVAIESLPGVFVSGTLYRPLKGKGPFPAVMVAQGHFKLQHFEEYCQVLCATLARMGAVAFSYDMFAKEEGILQFAAEDHSSTTAPTIQTINSTRVLDFLSSLPYVDPKRIAMTGASGGGTQTFLLTALDPRIAVSVPVVMVSSWFFGGCPCESGLPIHSCGTHGTNNVEIAAMATPRPMLVVSVGGDWTANVPDIEFPYLKGIYSFYGKSDLVQNTHFPNEGHDYGPSKRQTVYLFLAKHLGLNLKTIQLPSGEVDESKSVVEPKNALLVFGENGEKLPAHAIHGLDALKKILNP